MYVVQSPSERCAEEEVHVASSQQPTIDGWADPG